MGEKDANGEVNVISFSALPYEQWVLLNPSGSHPLARYKHGAAVVQDKLYVIGGIRNGRYLSDIQVFDFRKLKWSIVSLTAAQDQSSINPAFPALAGHSLVSWKNKLLVVVGRSKIPSDKIAVLMIDMETHTFSILQTSGKTPVAREGQSVSLSGSSLILFGGEDNKRKLLNDLHILDLDTLEWREVQSKNSAPAPRYDHTAAVYANQYLFIFGGSSHSICFRDLFLLDLQTLEWSQPDARGAYVNARGGHAAATIGENCYIVGGGDNKSGATETLVFDMSKFVWSIPTAVSSSNPLASEGLSLSSVNIDGQEFLVAFGGYNGKYHNEIFIMKPKPRDTLQPRLVQSPAAAAAAASVTAAYAIKVASDEKTIDVDVPEPEVKVVQSEVSSKEIVAEVESLKEAKRKIESRLSEVRDENSKLKENLDMLNLSYNELTLELKSVRSQLTAEITRCQKLESQIVAAQEKLDTVTSLEQELNLLRLEISQAEQSITGAQRQRSGGVWRWIAGNPQLPGSE